MMRYAAGAVLLLILLGGATPSRAESPASGEEARPATSFWDKFRLRGRKQAGGEEGPDLPRSVEKAQARLRASAIGRAPEAKAWLDLVDTGKAGGKDLNDFAALLVRKAFFSEASIYQRAAIELEPTNADLWVNLAMIERSLGRLPETRSACDHALEIDPNHAMGHYVLGTVHEAEKDFDGAIREYRISLQLDPRLGDAGFNPLAAYNEHLSLVKILNFRDQAGSIGLPILTMTSGPPPAPASVSAASPAPAAAPPTPAKRPARGTKTEPPPPGK